MGLIQSRSARRRLGNGRRSVRVIVAAMIVATLASCSGSDGGEASSPGSSAGSAPGAATGNAPGSTGGPAATAAATGVAAPKLAVLASRDAADKETPIRVELNELRVEGRLTKLTFTARNLAPVPPAGRSPDRWQIGAFFNDGINQKNIVDSSYDTFSVDGVYLLDPAAGKRYLAARNATQECVCSGNLASTLVSPGSGAVLTSLYAALPAGVNSVNVFVPGAGSFDGVAVSR
jgi:hypothetical protein